MSKEVARVDIVVNSDVPGTFSVIEAGSPIPAEHAELVPGWKARGLVGSDVAEDLTPQPTDDRPSLREVTQEEVDQYEDQRLRAKLAAQDASDAVVEALAEQEQAEAPEPKAEPKKAAPKPSAKR